MMSDSGHRSQFKYKGKEGKFAESALDDSDDGGNTDKFSKGFTCEEGLSISATTFTAGAQHVSFPGGPFSALPPSMCPQDLLAHHARAEVQAPQLEYRWDEFGFKVEQEDGPEEHSSKILSIPFVENSQHRLKWIAYLEFSHNSVVEDLTWEKIDPLLPRSDKLRSMIRAGGVPHSLRAYVWPRLCGAVLKQRSANFTYKEIMKASSGDADNDPAGPRLMAGKQIDKDLLRTLPSNACFMKPNSTGIPRLRRILRSIAYLYPDIGYCQGMGVIVCTLLLVMDEEDAFWMTAALIEDVLPASYYCNSLIGVQADQKVLMQLMSTYIPEVDTQLKTHDIELSLISLHWFLTLFSSVVNMKILVRMWDVLLYDGSVALFEFTLGMLKIRGADIQACGSSAQLFNLLSEIPGSMEDADYLLEVCDKLVAPSLSEATIHTQRKKHLAYLLADAGMLINPERTDGESNLPKQVVQRRRNLRRSQSIVSAIFRAGDSSTSAIGGDSIEDVRMKNVRQTELLVDLKDAILKVARHFMTIGGAGDASGRPLHSVSSTTSIDEQPQQHQQPITLTADYSLESHALDHEKFLAVHTGRCRRARALLDFERHDEDELGFRRHDIITIISQKDEHCWIGELNGLRGWFPAKFVELLDERSKFYTPAGDDAVSEAITDLVRGVLAPGLKAIFDHGIKRSAIIGGPVHPWLFIEDVAKHEVAKDFDSVYSRLVLCRTFRLDEDGKVLTPEELLYKAVQQINFSHDTKHAQMDVKFRSLVCLGLDEQVMHLWFELFCSCAPVVRKWYHRWSFIRSPGWVQIKCELRILAQFAFSLNSEWELLDPAERSGSKRPGSSSLKTGLFKKKQLPVEPKEVVGKEMSKPLRDGVRDMLVKHHLFSWDL